MTYLDEDEERDYNDSDIDFYREESDDLIDGVGFADEGGGSALRAETDENPRNLPCRTCHAPNALTPLDVARHYQCDCCANAAERGWDRDLACGGVENGCEICQEYEDSEETCIEGEG